MGGVFLGGEGIWGFGDLGFGFFVFFLGGVVVQNIQRHSIIMDTQRHAPRTTTGRGGAGRGGERAEENRGRRRREGKEKKKVCSSQSVHGGIDGGSFLLEFLMIYHLRGLLLWKRWGWGGEILVQY